MLKYLKMLVVLSPVLLISVGISLSAPDTDEWYAVRSAEWESGQIPPSYEAMREMNPEWDFMARTFLVLALTERALADPSLEDAALTTLDTIITDTLAAEQENGHGWYLLPYYERQPFVGKQRSLFVDGEILVMLGARRMLRDDAWQGETAERAAIVTDILGSGSSKMLGESYPDEGWMFCHAMAMIGLRMHETLDGADHSPVIDRWLKTVQSDLTHTETGMLISEFTMDGRAMDGPEGSSIWLTAVALQLIAPDLAQQQFDLAREHLGGCFLMMGYAREWPVGFEGPGDIDSGPVVPLLEASASSSGFAILASRAFGDRAWNRQLHRALGAAFFLMNFEPVLAQAADNPIGQTVVLWGSSFGPLWQAIGPRS